MVVQVCPCPFFRLSRVVLLFDIEFTSYMRNVDTSVKTVYWIFRVELQETWITYTLSPEDRPIWRGRWWWHTVSKLCEKFQNKPEWRDHVYVMEHSFDQMSLEFQYTLGWYENVMMICAYLFVIHQHSCHVCISRGFVVAFQLKNIIQCVVGNFKSGVNFPVIMVHIFHSLRPNHHCRWCRVLQWI